MLRMILATILVMTQAVPAAHYPAPHRALPAEQPGPRSIFPGNRPAHTLGQDAAGRWRI